MDRHALAHEEVAEPFDLDVGNHTPLRHLRIDLAHPAYALRRLVFVAILDGKTTSSHQHLVARLDETRMPFGQMQAEHIGLDCQGGNRLAGHDHRAVDRLNIEHTPRRRCDDIPFPLLLTHDLALGLDGGKLAL